MCHIVFIIQLPRVAGGCFVGFQGGQWLSVHIDDLRPQKDRVSILTLKSKSVSSLFEAAILARAKTDMNTANMSGLQQGWGENLLQEALKDEQLDEQMEDLENEDDGISHSMVQVR